MILKKNYSPHPKSLHLKIFKTIKAYYEVSFVFWVFQTRQKHCSAQSNALPLPVPPHFHLCSSFFAYLTLAKYLEDDSVTLWVNKAGPYFNPQETYSYYSLPYCRPADGDHKRGGLGEARGGNDIAESTLSLREMWRKDQFVNLIWMHQK
ncbi:hypothetical protein K7X08_004253 [Anisodus acutangulus]|uniref:Transmembrane 9 superfamily member n=1 Tax=Anisodus acutangulus TaxID=402998 RepID=A0A9Q1MGY0_9SOLA|nr:hypothetical protein K7X08_004253 [Anisodus acutangulus]